MLVVVTPPLLTLQLVKAPLLETAEAPMPPPATAPPEFMNIGTDAFRW